MSTTLTKALQQVLHSAQKCTHGAARGPASWSASCFMVLDLHFASVTDVALLGNLVHFILQLVDSWWTSLSSFVSLFGLPSTVFPPFCFHWTRYFIALSLKCGSHSLQFTTRGGSDYRVGKKNLIYGKEEEELFHCIYCH